MKTENDIQIQFICEQMMKQAADTEKQLLSEGWSEQSIKETVQNGGVFLVATENQNYLGHIGLIPILDEADVTNIVVKKEAQGKGIGKKLVLAAIDFCKSKHLSSLSLEVRQQNIVAKRLYNSVGFEQVGIRKGFYKNPSDDALIMTKKMID